MDEMTVLRKALWAVLRPLIQLITNLINPEIGGLWLKELNRFNRKEPCWVPFLEGALEGVFMRRMKCKEIVLDATKGTETNVIDTKINGITVHVDRGFELAGRTNRPTQSIVVIFYEMIVEDKLIDFLLNIKEVKVLCFTLIQISKFIIKNHDEFITDQNGTSFLFLSGGEMCISTVHVFKNGELLVRLRRLSRGSIGGIAKLRLAIPVV